MKPRTVRPDAGVTNPKDATNEYRVTKKVRLDKGLSKKRSRNFNKEKKEK